MGATEAWSDAAMGCCADLFDLDSPPSELLWYAMLNLGNHIGCSSYTDCALGRPHTLSPGDRRVYCKADKLDYGQIVDAMRQGRTVATSGGPLFVDATLAGRGVGETVAAEPGQTSPLRIRCDSLLPLRTIQVYCGGQQVKAFDMNGRTGKLTVEDEINHDKQMADWCVVRAENQGGDWAITSPIYVAPSSPISPVQASALLLEISNHTRLVELRRDFFAHLIVSVRPPEALREVRLCRDGKVIHAFKPGDGDRWHQQRVPVTDITGGEYGPGWAWHHKGDTVCHLQADWPMTDSGWYSIEATTTVDRVLKSDEVYFDADTERSQEISAARLKGPDTSISLLGYGEEMLRSEITPHFAGDHWWYPQQTFWLMRARFHGQDHEMKGGSNPAAAGKFRRAD